MKSACFLFFFNDTATTEIYTLSLHDALPIFFVSLLLSYAAKEVTATKVFELGQKLSDAGVTHIGVERSEEHTSELQSQSNLVCRLLLEKKKTCKQHRE